MTKSGKANMDAIVEGVGIERKATDVLKVTDDTMKAYIRDAIKYRNAVVEKGKKLSKETILQVEINADKIAESARKYAKENGVRIVASLEDIMKNVDEILKM